MTPTIDNPRITKVEQIFTEGGEGHTKSANKRGDYQLNTRISESIFKQFGSPSCDLFASKQNRQVHAYFSLSKDYDTKGWRGCDAFKFDWNDRLVGHLPYANPPWELIPQVLLKVQRDRVPKLLLICPSLTHEIQQLSRSPPIVIRHKKDTYLPPSEQSKQEPKGIGMPHWPCSFAVLISGETAPTVDVIPALDYELPKMTFLMTITEGTKPQVETNGLVDSGSQVNIISQDLVSTRGWTVRRGAAVKMKNANGESSWSRKRVQLTISKGTYSRQVEFLVGDIAQPVILGTPWITHIQLTQLRPQFGKLMFKERGSQHVWWTVAQTARIHTTEVNIVEVDDFETFCNQDPMTETFCIFNIDSLHSTQPLAHTDSQIRGILDRYPRVFEEPRELPPSRKEDHRIILQPDADIPPIRGIGRLDEERLKVLKETLEKLLQKGYITPSTSPYGANILFARKPDGSYRLCIDYRGLNAITKKDSTPLPHLGELRDRLSKAKVFSKMDLRDGFYNILMATEDRHKTAFRTRYGHYEWVVLPMGLCNSPATFQTLMNRLFGHLYDEFVIVYLDDILIYSEDKEKHLGHLNEVLKICDDNTLFIKPSKCTFGSPAVTFCGQTFSSEGVLPDHNKAKTLQKLPLSNIKELQSFLGLTNWFKDFIPDYANIALPLTSLLPKEAKWNWGKEQQGALNKLVDIVQSQPCLRHFDPTKPTSVYTDSSDFAIGGWIGQPAEDHKIHPVVYWSRKLTKAELRYAIPEKELLALVALADAHRPYLSGSNVTLRTDHKPLVWLQSQPVLTPRQVRWVCKLQELNLNIEYIPGTLNTVADFLSRQPAVSPKCAICANKILEYDPESWDPIVSVLDAAHLELSILDISSDINRQKQVIKDAHDSPTAGHPGVARTMEKIKRLYIWPSLQQDIQAYVRTCDACQRNKTRNTKPLGLLQSIPVPSARFTCIGIDWFYLPVDSQQFDTVMIIVDYFTKFTVLIPCKSTNSSSEIAALFKQHWVDKGFGVPTVIISDRDSKLTSKFWKKLCSQLKISLQLATARHQQTNGQTERTIRLVKTTLLTSLDFDTSKWRSVLPSVEFAINDSINSTTGFTPFFLTLGQHPNSPTTVLDPIHPWATVESKVKESIEKAQASQARQYNKYRSDHEIKVGDNVLLERDGITWPAEIQKSKRLLSPWLGPFKVLNVSGNNVDLQLPPSLRIHNTFSVSKVKPYFSRPGTSAPSPDFIDGAPEYEVEKVLSHRTWRKHLQYLVKWKSMGHERNQWLFADDMMNCQNLIEDYLSTRGGVTEVVESNPKIRMKLRFKE